MTTGYSFPVAWFRISTFIVSSANNETRALGKPNITNLAILTTLSAHHTATAGYTNQTYPNSST